MTAGEVFHPAWMGRATARWATILASVMAAAWLAAPATAHDVRLPVAGALISIQTNPAFPAVNQFSLQMTGQAILLNLDPRVAGSALLVHGLGADAGTTGLIELDPSLWTALTTLGVLTEYRYADAAGSRGGITSVTLRQGELIVSGGGPNWPWAPIGAQNQLWAHFKIEEEWLCAVFDDNSATLIANAANDLEWASGVEPFACPDQLCSNGIRELPEACDDGNLIEGDGCSVDCASTTCNNPSFASTYDAIQSVIFDGYGCSSSVCHSSEFSAILPLQFPAGGLDLTAGVSHSQLFNVQSTAGLVPGGTGFMDRVEPGEPASSFLFEKLAAKTNGTPTTLAPMPLSLLTLTPDHLQAVERWIRFGAPQDTVVDGTAGLLASCLPPPDPAKLDPPPSPPATGAGVQLWQTAWPLPANSEDEICTATYYDFTQTNLVPPEVQVDCPGFASANNPSGKCFYYHRQVLLQDAQSHHSIISLYTGDSGVDDPGPPATAAIGFGPFTLKPNDALDPNTGASCDPRVVAPNTGFNQDCSGVVVSGVACTGHGPTDAFSAELIGGSQEPFIDNTFAPGVYALLPMSGVVIWNSHAFNLTQTDTTLAQYFSFDFAGPEDRQFQKETIFDIDKIFVQNVPAFETREYCKTITLPKNSRVFELSSHTHRWGNQFRIWQPPNAPCDPGGQLQFTCEPNCKCGPGDPDQLIYFSKQYTDPVQLTLDPPLAVGTSKEDRTFLYCSVYDNGSTPLSPSVKRQSSAVSSPPFDFFGLFGDNVEIELGGACGDAPQPIFAGAPGVLGVVPGVACMDGPNQGVACGSAADPASFCETAPGAADGDCDACSVLGGFTTSDEMFILIGSYFVPEPSATALSASALVALGLLARRRRRSHALSARGKRVS